ncbi:MraZ protein [Bacilli bacterium PM5-3]|nr:MraZ protein [Bacilli bacterium PM5-3]MDH6603238.1 MraZ protein [Bacilli bacterium PM5-9]
MFIGQYNHNIDAKGRMILPAKFRDKVGEEIVVARGLDGCLSAYPMEKWKEIETKLSSLPTTKKQARAYARMVLSSAADLEFDKTGRINIPTHLLKIASLEKKCIVVGVGDYFEIWDENKWQEYNSSVEESFEDIAEDLVDFEI